MPHSEASVDIDGHRFVLQGCNCAYALDSIAAVLHKVGAQAIRFP